TSRSRCRAASTPAATTTSATSACSASTRTARNSTRSRSAAAPRATRRWAPSSGLPSRARMSSTRSRRLLRPTFPSAARASASSKPIAASVPRRSRSASMPLLKNGAVIDDRWRRLADDDPLPGTDAVIVSLARWRADRALAGRGGPLGLALKNNDPVLPLAGELHRFELIALEFPKFTDGRAYSQARILRERLGFKGELRAT